MGLSSAMAQAPASQQKPPDATKDAPKAAEQPDAPGQQPPAGQKTAQEQFKNIQVLKTVPAEDLLPTMRYISAALGVDCNFCHVRNPDFAPEKDDKKEKQTARKMMQMVMTINQENFEGHQDVSCNSCHNGHNRPQTIPPMATEAAIKERLQARANQPPQGAPGQPQAQQPQQGPPPEARPSAESLFQKYEQAIGGSAAIAKISSRYMKGSLTSPLGNSDFEQYNQAPDKFWVSTTSPRGARVQAWDGSQGWTRAGKVEPMRDVADMKITADFYRSLKFTDRYKGARVFRKEKVGDRDAWVVMVRIPDSPLSDMLYFDTDSGLLLRRTTLRRTALGPLPNTADFADYRDVGGVKMPFKVTLSTPDSLQNIQVSEIKFNVPVEDTRFAMPASTE